MMTEHRIALRNAGKINPESIDDYIQQGGYEAFKKALTMEPSDVIAMVGDAAGLRGRGGAGFSVGFKWRSALQTESDIKYIICNADEGEPGTYKDRVIIENDPHTVLEGMLIAAHATGATQGIIYCRGEYTKQIALLKDACLQLKASGIAKGIDISVASGAGSYVCGEETALINSLEGKRGEPRLKPPFPTIAGYMGKPTVVNNVETFANVPVIIEKGGQWYSAIGAKQYPGTKIFSLSGDVVNKTCFEVPTDATLRDIVFGFGGGIVGGRKLKAMQLGGCSCAFLTPDKLDTQVNFEAVRDAGGMLGSGAVLVIDDSHNIVDILVEIANFFNHESCGKCVPCREGSYRVAQIMKNIAAGNGSMGDLELLKEMSDYMAQTSFCPLGQSATTALMSALALFPEDFEAKIVETAGVI